MKSKLDTSHGFCSHPAVKLSLSLLILAAIISTFSGCTTLANRRDVYRPAEASGPYTTRYAPDRRNEGLFGVSQNDHHPRSANEGIFGISNSDARYRMSRGTTQGGLFGVSRTVH